MNGAEKIADQGLANQIQGFKILTCCDASEKIRINCIFFCLGLREASLSP